MNKTTALRAIFLTTLCLFTWQAAYANWNWPHSDSDVAPDSRIVWGKLDNGMHYALLPNNEPPGRLSIRLLVRSGSLQESEEQRGLAHFLEHMAFNGTTHFAADEMVEYFQRLGMAFGADTNAHTSFDETVYKLELPDVTDAILTDSFMLLRDYADRMLLGEEELEKERGVILAEKSARDSAESRAFEAEFLFLLPESRLPQRMPIGLEEVIKTAPREAFVDYYSKWYTPRNTVLVAVGSLAPDTFETMVKEHFGDWQEKESAMPEIEMGKVIERELVAGIHSDPELSATQVSIQTVVPIERKPDTIANREAALFRELGFAVLSRRLEIAAKKEDAPFSRGVAYVGDWFHHVRNAGVELTTTAEQWDDALGTAEQLLRQALEYGFHPVEINEAAAKIRNAYEQAVREAPTRKSRELSDGLVEAISSGSVFSAAETDLELINAALAKATPEIVNSSFREVWKPRSALYVSGNFTGAEEPTADSIVATYKASQAVAVTEAEVNEQADFVYQEFGDDGEIVGEISYEDLGVTRLDLANNITVFLKPTDFESGVIHVAARFGYGRLSEPKDAQGLALVAESVFTQGGLEEHSIDELERLFAGKNVGVNLSVGEDAFVLVGKTTEADFRAQLNLMCAYLSAPGYREESLRVAQRQFEKLFGQLATNPQGVLQNEVARYLANGDHRFGIPPKEEALSRSMGEVRAWLEKPLASARLTLAVVGNFENAKVIPEILSTFGALGKREKDKPLQSELRYVVMPSSVEPAIFTVQTDIPRAFANLYWPTEAIWDISRTRRLSVLAEVLSDRLRVKIREELGEAYSPFAYNRPSEAYIDFGYTTTMIMCSPDTAEKILEITKTLAEDLATNGVRGDERERAIKPLLNALQEQVRNNQYWLNRVLLPAAETPQRLDWARSMVSDFASITDAELNELAAAYLRAEQAIPIMVLPAAAAKSSE